MAVTVSNFELLFKKQAPAAPADLQNVQTVLQGYFLELTNLADTDYEYRLEFVIAAPPPRTTDRQLRSLAGNAVAFVDSAGRDNRRQPFGGDVADTSFTLPTGNVRVPAGGTALVAVLPAAFGSDDPLTPSPNAAPAFEVRGYVRISLPSLLETGSGSGVGRLPPIRIRAQSDEPVPVLLTPQNRATYIAADGTIANQTQASLPLAGGQGTVEVPPGSVFPLDLEPGTAQERLTRANEMLTATPEELRPALLATLLAEARAGGFGSLDALNRRLEDLGVDLSLAA